MSRIWEFHTQPKGDISYINNEGLKGNKRNWVYRLIIQGDDSFSFYRSTERKILKYRTEHEKDPKKIMLGLDDYRRLVSETCEMLNKPILPDSVVIGGVVLEVCFVPGLSIVYLAGTPEFEFLRAEDIRLEKLHNEEQEEEDENEERSRFKE